jgi:hypothetical protein
MCPDHTAIADIRNDGDAFPECRDAWKNSDTRTVTSVNRAEFVSFSTRNEGHFSPRAAANFVITRSWAAARSDCYGSSRTWREPSSLAADGWAKSFSRPDENRKGFSAAR